LGACPNRVLVVDDDGNCRSMITTVIGRAGFETVEAATGDEALDAARRERPRAVLLDIDLPGVNGYEVCAQLRERHGHDLPIIFLSGARIESFDRAGGLLIGADDYVVKPFDPGELVARLRRLDRRARAADGRGTGRSRESPLTRREEQIYGFLVKGLSQKEIAAELVISGKTVATHIQRILAKLGVHSRAQAVALAVRGS
jgi:DNA-binding NarL/FixJ family response regulator